MDILAEGGNAFDAAITVSAVLAVVEPYSSGIGGGGFWLLHRERDGYQVMVDGRETAPRAATRDMYLDEAGVPVPGLSINGALAAGIPGAPAALAHISTHYGRLSLAQTLAPAIKLAEQGFAVDEYYQRMAKFRLDALQADEPASRQFLDNDEIPGLGYLIRQPDLAMTLRAMAEDGHDGFYGGDVAAQLVAGVRATGGIWTKQDLADYQVIERRPVTGRFGEYRVVTAALPSSGGIVLIQILNMLSELAFDQADPVQQIHLLTEAMRRAYRDRALYLGDSAYADVPINHLLSLTYTEELAASINAKQATPSEFMPMENAEGQDTTHFSILDQEGNRVSATLSVNYPFGACVVPPGTGVLLNDEMDDFSKKPGTPNAYGLVGNEANAIEPGKRMLSSMTPTFVEHRDHVAILGTPGGSRIITMVLLGVLEYTAGKSPDAWVARKRIHHQYLPDELFLEPDALTAEHKRKLEAMGHTLHQKDDSWGNMQAVYWNRKNGEVSAASDPRGIGSAQVSGD